MRRAPRLERRIKRCDAAGAGVQEIAEHHEPRGTRAATQRREPRKVGLRVAARQRHAAGAKCGGLAEMHVGDEERAPARASATRARRRSIDALAAQRRVVTMIVRCGVRFAS